MSSSDSRCNSPSLSTLAEEKSAKSPKSHNEILGESVDIIHNTVEIKIYFSQEYWRAIYNIEKCFSNKKNTREYRRRMIDHLLKKGCILNISIILQKQLNHALETLKTRKDFRDTDSRSIVYNTLNIFNLFAEESETFACEVVKKPCTLIDCLNTLLDSFKLFHFRQELKKELTEMLFLCLVLAYNLVMHDNSNSINAVRDRHLWTSVRPYVYSIERFKMMAFMFMLFVSNEAELCSDPLVIGELFSYLTKSRASKDGIAGRFTRNELMRALEKLTVLNVDRKLLYDIGLVDRMQELLLSSDVEEIQCALCVLTNFTFDADKAVAEEIKEKFYAYTQQHIKEHENQDVKKAATSLIWVIEEKLSLIEGVPCSSSDPRVFKRSTSRCPRLEGASLDGGERSIAAPVGQHIMISYQWDHQAKVRTVKEYLQAKGFEVWYDEVQMEMNLLDSMAAAVENAWVVLVCYSRKYKFSRNCRLEAEYASKQKKPMIPVQMEDFDPDGWLGLLIGRLFFHKFCDECTPQESYDGLLLALRKLKRRIHDGDSASLYGTQFRRDRRRRADCRAMEGVEPAIHPMTATVCGAGLSVGAGDTMASLRSHADRTLFGHDLSFLGAWSRGDLDKWLDEIGLNRQLVGVESGRDLRLLLQMRKEAPNSFFNYLTKRCSLSETARLAEAMENLIFSQQVGAGLPRINFPM